MNIDLDPSVEDRIAKYTKIEDPSDHNLCHVWVGYKSRYGYGRLSVNGKPVNVHRLVYERINGPIPDGLEVRHICPHGSRRDCVNPSHLAVGTRQDNMDDMVREGRQHRAGGESNGNAKLTDDQVAQIKTLWATGRYTKTKLGLMYGVSDVQICYIINGKSRKSS